MNFRVNDKDYNSEIISYSNDLLVMKINGKKYTLTVKQDKQNSYVIQSGNKPSHKVITVNTNGKFIIYCCGETINVESIEASGPKLSKSKGSGVIEIKAPIPGLINEIACKPGDQLEAGNMICILDAMKMHNEINSPDDGIIEQVFAKVGEQVEKNAILATLKCRK